MDIQAYFEEWSCLPGDTVRMAISTPHPTVSASFARLLSGPGKGENEAGRFTELNSILDRTIAVSPKSTIVGSYAELPLPQGIGSGPVSVHCWIFPTLAHQKLPQAVWSLDRLCLFIREGVLQLVCDSVTIASLAGALVSGHWYSVVASVGNGKAVIDLRRLDGKINAHRRVETEIGADISGAATLMLATSGLDAAGSPRCCYNGKVDSPSIYEGLLSAGDIGALHDGRESAVRPWASWELGKDFASSNISPAGTNGKSGRLVNGAERGCHRPQLGWPQRLVHGSAGTVLRLAVPRR